MWWCALQCAERMDVLRRRGDATLSTKFSETVYDFGRTRAVGETNRRSDARMWSPSAASEITMTTGPRRRTAEATEAARSSRLYIVQTPFFATSVFSDTGADRNFPSHLLPLLP